MSEALGRPRPPSIRDVALAAGVSYQTVSRVLNGHDKISAATKERVHAAVGELGYRPNRAARALVTSRTRTIGVLITARALYGPFNAFLAIEEAAREQHYGVSAAPNASDDAEGLAIALDGLLTHGAEGLVVIAPQDRAREAIRRSGARVPLVTLQGGPGEPDGVGIDQAGGARVATRHLIELGHRRVVHLAGPVGWAEAELRREGYAAEMVAHGLEPEVVVCDGWTPDAGYGAGGALLDAGGATAAFCANDEIAIGLLAAARERGVDVPGRLSVVGFDDIPSARYLAPPLTTVVQDFGALGRAAIARLIERIEGADSARPPVLPSGFVVRGSTARVTI